MRAFDDVEGREGILRALSVRRSYNPGKFISPASTKLQQSGNYLLYWMASQALWRVNPEEAKGLDGTLAYDWSPPSVNRNNMLLTAGLRFNEPLPPDISPNNYVTGLRAKQFQRSSIFRPA